MEAIHRQLKKNFKCVLLHNGNPFAYIVDLPFRITTCRFLLAIVFRT